MRMFFFSCFCTFLRVSLILLILFEFSRGCGGFFSLGLGSISFVGVADYGVRVLRFLFFEWGICVVIVYVLFRFIWEESWVSGFSFSGVGWFIFFFSLGFTVVFGSLIVIVGVNIMEMGKWWLGFIRGLVVKYLLVYYGLESFYVRFFEIYFWGGGGKIF